MNKATHFKKHQPVLINTGLVFVMIIGTFVLLRLLGIIHFSAPDFEKIKASVETSADSATMVAADEAALRKNYGIDSRDLEGFIYYAPKSAMDASEILILQAKSESSLNGWRSTIESRRTTRADMYRNYRPEEALLLEKSELKVQGNYLIFISAHNVSEVKAAVEQSFR